MKKTPRLLVSATLSLAFLAGAGVVWYKAIVPSFTQASFNPPAACTTTTKGCYGETWTATEVLGDVAGYDFGGYSAIVTVPDTTDSFKQNGIQATGFRVSGTIGTPGFTGILNAQNTSPVVIQWHVDGFVSE